MRMSRDRLLKRKHECLYSLGPAAICVWRRGFHPRSHGHGARRFARSGTVEGCSQADRLARGSCGTRGASDTSQRAIMELVLAGRPSKNMAAGLGISQLTVENHRASIMKKMGAKSLPELTRLALAATSKG